MGKGVIRRYIFVVAVLIVCAGIAWYTTKASDVPQENAVLASRSEQAAEQIKDAAGIQMEGTNGGGRANG